MLLTIHFDYGKFLFKIITQISFLIWSLSKFKNRVFSLKIARKKSKCNEKKQKVTKATKKQKLMKAKKKVKEDKSEKR